MNGSRGGSGIGVRGILLNRRLWMLWARTPHVLGYTRQSCVRVRKHASDSSTAEWSARNVVDLVGSDSVGARIVAAMLDCRPWTTMSRSRCGRIQLKRRLRARPMRKLHNDIDRSNSLSRLVYLSARAIFLLFFAL